jgi:hypothetical protein
MSEEVELCPFCGKPFVVTGSSNTSVFSHDSAGCPLHEREKQVISLASERLIAALNTRPLEDALRARITELEADRDSEARWAKEYLARALKAEKDAELLAQALKDLQMAVAYDLRHGDNEDEDKAWDALNKLSDSLSQASTALAAHDAAKDGPP